jgi:hypothetical protein
VVFDINRVGLVIQGPRLSSGRSSLSLQQISDNSIIDFDCTETILRNYNTGKSLFNRVVVVTWQSEFNADLRLAIPTSDLIILNPADVCENFPTGSFINRNKQVISTLTGIQELEKSCKYILKIRSDSSFPLESFGEFLKTDINEDFIYVPYFDPANPNFINDFYFFGKSQLLKRMLNGLMPGSSLLENIHYDMFYTQLKPKRIKHYLTTRLTKHLLFILRNNAYLNKRFIKYSWNNLFRVLPKDLYLSSTWRGYSLSHDKSAKTYGFRETFVNNFSTQAIHNFQLNSHLRDIILHKFGLRDK